MVAVAVAVGLAVEPVGFDGFFRAYGRYMGALCACVEHWVIMRRRIMRALWGFGEIAENTPKKGGARQMVRSHLKEECQRKKKIKKSFKIFAFSC